MTERAPHTSYQAKLATCLRASQWELDEAAFDVGAGRYTAEQQEALADRLTKVAEVLRSNPSASIVIDAGSR